MSPDLATGLLVLGWLPMLVGVRRQGRRGAESLRPHGLSVPPPAGPLAGAGLEGPPRRRADSAGPPRDSRDAGPAPGPRAGLRPGVGRFDAMLLLLTWIACVALTAAALVSVRHSAAAPRLVWGTGLFLAGIALWVWGRAAWKADFAQMARVPGALVTRGPYRFLRHPLYLSTAIATLGQAVAEGTWLGAGLWACVVAILALRAWREERLLRAAFGPAWDAYARRTWGFRT